MINKGDQAHKWAEEVYNLSKQCLMAHSVRAVEYYIEHKLDNAELRLPHKIKVTESSPLMYLGKRAIVYISAVKTEIQVDKDLGFENKRMAIAHELGHILFAKCKGGNNKISKDLDTESACQIFERHLCTLHHQFYKDPLNIARIKFPSLDPEARA